ncbi:MAG: CRISPR-associated endonuclease/helicase Cas3, partial [Solirubrobacteraceae bacterium]|nr:CRISPR-associated endonuclease/helicase Cas3 [Solirubrobacteraceae bacterium]
LIWALAMQADRPPHERTIGVRTVWAIDRRILVDEVHDRATDLSERLAAAVGNPVDDLYHMAQRLRSFTGSGGQPLVVTRWRGGIPRESRAHHPFQPEIITSTVAQIGSRLLFRGYGVGERSLALEAGLAAVDTTICLDEAHLAEPFRQTVEAIRGLRAAESIALPVLRSITLTATPVAGLSGTDVHGITDEDRAALGPRLTGAKQARLVEPPSDKVSDQVAALVDAVEEQLEAGASTVACVVNSVRTALEVEAGIARRRPDVAHALLIGPQRPLDRKQLLERHRGQLFERAATDVPLVCVATQTFEVGLDADVEALVTQSASATAIVQRLGRLNRAGERRGRATIVRDTQSPLYEDDEEPAWLWLRSREGPDGAIDASVGALMDDATRPAPAKQRGAPLLSPHVVGLLVQTAPRPAPMADPDVEVFLRGAEERTSNDVGLCWRCDLRIEDDSESARSYRKALLRLVPPDADEIFTISIAKAHTLLRALRAPRSQLTTLSKASLEVPDIEGADNGELMVKLPDAERDDDRAPARLVLLRGRDQHEVSLDGAGDPGHDLRLRDIRPGDLLVLATSAGGYGNRALDPASRSVVRDVAPDVRAATDADEPPTALRLTEEVLRRLGLDVKAVLHRAGKCEAAGDDRGLEELLAMLGTGSAQIDPREVTLSLRRITDDAPTHFGDLYDEDEDPLAVLGDVGEEEASDDVPLLDGELPVRRPAFVLLARRLPNPDELRPSGKAPPTLDSHARAVAARARHFVAGMSLPHAVSAAVILAARAHDHGKGDPRFQAFFHGGIPAFGATPTAKSVFGTADVQASRRARVAAGLPSGLRHEIASVAALDNALDNDEVTGMPDEVDRELALHLVATHHGLGRPIPRVPSLSNSAPREFVVDAAGITATARGDAIEGWDEGAWLSRFLAIVDRYGAWGSAYLEALMVLADRTVSQEGG